MIATVVMGLMVFSLLVCAAFLAFTLRFRPRPEARVDLGIRFPRVSILKPLKNRADELAVNLESYFILQYPNYEIIFGLDTMNDAALPLIRSLQRRFPDVPVSVVATGHSDEVNPKIFKLARMERAASGDLFWVTDANTRVAAGTLNRLVREYMGSGAQLVFSPIRGTGSCSLASLMENMSLNLFTSGSIIAAWKMFRQQIVVGKSMLIGKAALEQFGGFFYFSDFLAEDFVIGEAFENAGLRLACGFTWIDSVSRSTSMRGFFLRQVRWAKLRLSLRPAFYLLEVLLNPVAVSLALPMLAPRIGWQLLAGAWMLKVAIEFTSYRILTWRRGEPLRNLMILPAAAVLKDLILLVVYFVPFFSRTVVWQGGGVAIGRRTRIVADGERLVLEGA